MTHGEQKGSWRAWTIRRRPRRASILLFDVKEKHGISRLGLMVNEFLESGPETDPVHARRYRFVARMLQGRDHVLEVGCADAFGTRIVQQAVVRSPPPTSIRSSSKM